jgi:hypothetical protein
MSRHAPTWKREAHNVGDEHRDVATADVIDFGWMRPSAALSLYLEIKQTTMKSDRLSMAHPSRGISGREKKRSTSRFRFQLAKAFGINAELSPG